jgi:tetratricopeptide (TPR) repeat protein
LLDQVRIFPNLREVCWDYRIHEQILPSVNRIGGAVRWTNIIVDHVGYIEADTRKRKLERNLKLLELEHQERPRDSFNLFNLGWTLLDLGELERANQYLNEALECASATSSILRKLYHLLSLSKKALRDLKEALQNCRRGLKVFPDDGELLLEEGILLRDLGDLPAAERSWIKLLEMKPSKYFSSEELGLRGYKTRRLLAEILQKQGRTSDTEIQWLAALREEPKFEVARFSLAELYLSKSRWGDLDELLQKSENEGIASTQIELYRARIHYQRKEFSTAKRILEQAISADAKLLPQRILLSQVLLSEAKDWKRAEAVLQEILVLDPNHADSKNNINVLRRRLGQESSQKAQAK